MKAAISLRVMTFNTLKNGHCVKDGPQKIANHIEAVRPDIVLLQELKADEWHKTTAHLNPEWFCARDHGLGIVSKHRILPEHRRAFDDFGMAATIEIEKENSNFRVNTWNLHTDHHHYGPYATFGPQTPVSYEAVLKCEEGRMGNMKELFADEVFLHHIQQAENGDSFLVVGGDFNSPSHLDWTPKAASQHRDWCFTWPVSSTMTSSGFTDSFRAVHPDPTKMPGTTWSTLFQGNRSWSHECPGGEPQDRIDHIYHRGGMLQPVKAFTYCGSEKLNLWNEGHYENDWPSDHYAVVVDYSAVVL